MPHEQGNEATPESGKNNIPDNIDSLALVVPPAKTKRVPAFGNKLPKRVVLLGWDGATWKIINRLLAQGEMPNLRRLLEYSAAGILQTDVAISPISWTTIATGKSKEHHGVGENSTNEMDFFDTKLTSESVIAIQIWDMFPTDRFARRAVLAYFMPPPFQKFNGLIFHQGALFAPGSIQNLCDEGNPDLDTVCLLSKAPFDAAFSIMSTTDAFGHEHYYSYLLQQMHERGDVTLKPAYAEKIKQGAQQMIDAYRLVDKSIASFLNKPDTLVVIASDHGMQAACNNRDEFFLKTEFFAEFQAEILDYDPHKKTSFQAKVGNSSALITVKPTTTSWPIGQWKQNGQPLNLDLIAPVLECRSSIGSKCPKSVAEKIKSVLATMTVQGKPLYDEGEKTKRGLVFTPNHEALALLSQTAENIENPYFNIIHFQGDHGSETPGVIVLAGPGVKPGARIEKADLMDVTPTILALSGLPIADDFDGRVLTDAITKSFLAAHPLKSIATYGKRDITKAKKPLLSLQQKRHLRELGYLN